ncbi:MAG: hypothetical protein JNJ60_06210 [Rhodocyclaceae bacterium]|nr:hypothetical protein [Rhodocyclaceae bacterium]
MLAWLDKLMDRSAAWLPAVWARADRYLLLHYPLLWRSRLVPVLLLALPLCLASAAAGLAIPMQTQNVWTEAEIANAVGLYVMAMGLVAAIWLRALMRYPLGERGLADQLRTTFYAFLVLLALLAPPRAFYGGLSTNIAGVMPRDQFESAYRYLEARNYWCCTDAIDEAMVEAERERVDQVLAQFGLRTRGKVYWGSVLQDIAACRATTLRWKCLVMTDAQGALRPSLLRERVQSIGSHLQFGTNGPASVLRATWSGSASWASVAAAIALVITFAGIPGSVWNRLLPAGIRPARSLPGRSIRTLLPGVLRRLDRKLLLARPVVWSMALHRALPAVVAINLLGLVVVVVGAQFGKTTLSLLLAIVPATVIAIGIVVWLAVFRTHAVPTSKPPEIRTLVLLTVLAIMCLPALWSAGSMLALNEALNDRIYLAIVWSAISACFTVACVAPVVLAANFTGWLPASAGLAAAVFLITAFGVYLNASSDGSMNILLSTLLSGAVLVLQFFIVRRARAGWRKPVRARLLLSLLASLWAMCAASFTTAGSILVVDRSSIGDAAEMMVVTGALVLQCYLSFRWILMPSLLALARLRCEPGCD